MSNSFGFSKRGNALLRLLLSRLLWGFVGLENLLSCPQDIYKLDPMLSQMISIQIITHAPLLSRVWYYPLLCLWFYALQVIGIHFHPSSQPRPAHLVNLEFPPDVTFTKSCVLSSPALRFFVGFRYCSQFLVLEHSHFFPCLGATNTFYGHDKQKVELRVHDFFFMFFSLP